jgi:NRPS condensation-like uncharacterized protein
MSNSTKLRVLGSLENLFAAYAETGAMVFSMAVEFCGALDIHELTAAASAIQVRYPLLAVSLGFDENHQRAFFVTERPIAATLNYVQEYDLDAEFARELNGRFDIEVGPLARISVLATPQVNLLMITFHHAVADGMDAIAVAVDLIQHLNGQSIGGVQPSTTLDQTLGRPLPHHGHMEVPSQPRITSMELADVHSVELDNEQTNALRQKAREQGATVHGALLVAMHKAFPLNGKGAAARIMSPIDGRRLVQQFHGSGIHISIGISDFNNEGPDFWQEARRVADGLKKARSLPAMTGFINAIGDRMLGDGSYAATRERLIEESPFDAILTNLGTVEITDGNEFTVRRIIGPALRALSGQPVVGACTFKGKLVLVNTAVAAKADILKRMRTELLRAIE